VNDHRIASQRVEADLYLSLLSYRIGVAGTANVQGEDQKKLDILSNDIMVNSLRASGESRYPLVAQTEAER
jgi:fructose-1,6-bisphosphatase I